MTLNPTVTGRDDWTTATFDTATPDGKTYSVTGMVRLWFGIHRRQDGWWRLTHLPTGFALGEAKTEGQIVRAVAEIKGAIGWDFSDPAEFGPDAPHVLRPILQRHGAAFERQATDKKAA